jgi:N-methylhydantoinase B/oxoprolinase/acetone carboxylase alpha subunit
MLKPGDVVRVQTNAGGGFGDPLEREPELVLGDVLDRYVTLDHAREDYGVVIDAQKMSVNVQATQSLRALKHGGQ